ncbi:MAG: YqeG family HAD IIIA-type phosphatase [Defluviitaleaceae bacterium]|nr:YqeG family HAD IIIA-type phosphatase [Defluviitaleaceae bacterium]MCL2836578.1 YqeG family HAD IIIA-type phosphatase [Defluviitaleaceae bacterium]
MLSRLCPDEYADSVKNIDYRGLLARGIKGLIFDVDNTLEGYEASVPSEATAAFLLSLAAMGFKLCLVSNNNRERIETFNQTLGFPAVHKSGKPSRKAVWRAAELMDVPAASIALIGDQVFTDVICGKRSGTYTALVKPVTANDPWMVALKRIPERWIVKYIRKRLKK